MPSPIKPASEIIKKTTEKIRETWLLRGRLTKGILLTACFLVIAFMLWLVFVYSKNYADQEVFDAIAPYITLSRTRFILAITSLGNSTFLLPLNLLLFISFLVAKKYWLALRLAVVSLGGLTIKFLIKIILHRARPINPVIEGGVGGFSFPSGHALLAVAFYGFLIWWVAISIRKKWLQLLLIFWLVILILLVGFSRVYLRVHYTTDILAGFSMGFAWLIFALWQLDRLEIKQLEKRKKAANTLASQ